MWRKYGSELIAYRTLLKVGTEISRNEDRWARHIIF